MLGLVSDDGDRVARGDECTLSVDHITVAIAVTGSTELDVVLLDGLDKGVGVDKVGIWVSSTKVGKRNAVLDGRFGETESLDEDGSAVWTSDAMQAVEEDLEIGVGLEEGFDEREVEDTLEEGEVILD